MSKEDKQDSILDCARQIEIWFWDGDSGHVVGCIDDEQEEWLVEKGILCTEDENAPGVKDLIEGDTVYRIRKSEAINNINDPREKFFIWFTVNPVTGSETPRMY